MKLPRFIAVAGLAVLLLAGIGREHRAAADSSPTDPYLEDVVRLADPDPAVREKAARALWSAGQAAVPALRQAADGDDPETAARARRLLRDIEYGLSPDTPPEVLDLINQYHAADHAGRVIAVNRLAGLGARGVRVLLGLRRETHDDADRDVIFNALVTHAHDAAGAMIASGELEAAESLLQSAAPSSEYAARDYAAFLCVRGTARDKLPAMLAWLDRRPDTSVARAAAYLARAAGDLPAARAAAEKAADPKLVNSLLIEQGDWKTLCDRTRSTPGDSSWEEGIARAVAFARLAGDGAALDKAAAALIAHAERHPESTWPCATALLLNDRIDDGIKLLEPRSDFANRLSELLLPRLEFQAVLELARRELAGHGRDGRVLAARSAVALRFMGRLDDARHVLADLTANPATLRPDEWLAVINADRALGEADAVEKHQTQALTVLPPGGVLMLLALLRLPSDFDGAWWWEFLRRTEAETSPADSWKTLRALSAGQLPEARLDALCERLRQDAARPNLPAGARRRSLKAAGLALYAAKHYKPALQCFVSLSEVAGVTNPEALLLMGDARAGLGDWRGAADAYGEAWDVDRSRPIPLALRAWALERAGDAATAHDLAERARLLPLCDEYRRWELADVLAAHGLAREAEQERAVVLHTGEFLSWFVCQVCEQRGDEAMRKGDALAAADWWEHAFLENLRENVGFADPWANIAVPAAVHKARALGLSKAGDAAGALREARACVEHAPVESDALIELVNDLHTHHHDTEAEALFTVGTAIYRKLCADYPQSNHAHNLLAWTQAGCRRELDDALAHAQKAVALEPANTASLDTLAEVYFVRGETAQAVETIEKCIALEPDEPSHRKRLEQFKSAGVKRSG